MHETGNIARVFRQSLLLRFPLRLRLRLRLLWACSAASVFLGCRDDGATREVMESDVVGGRYVRFEDAAGVKALSLAARDELPAREDVEAYLAGVKGREALLEEWYASPSHGKRVGRIFGDLFGIPDTPFVVRDGAVLVTNARGAYESHNGETTCEGDEPLERVFPWWEDGGRQVDVCAALACGVGALRCAPKEAMPKVRAAVAGELADRARHAYTRDLDWTQLWAGNWIYGNRYLFFAYAYESMFLESTAWKPAPPAADQAALLAFVRLAPRASATQSTLPAFLPARAGVVTAPQFLKRHNNFRSRIRALSQNLSCEDVGVFLNTSGISSMINPSLSAFDRSHGAKPGCASCHYGMDNLGSSLLGWSDVGHREWWHAPSQKGHAFGVEGDGPGFLMRTWVERGPRFQECMARQVWASFSGGRDFSSLGERTRGRLVEAAERGLRGAVRATLASPELTRVDP